MSLMSFFSSKPATPAPAATPDPASAPAAAAPVPAPEPQGLDKYSNLWKAPEPQKPQPSVLDLDQGKVVEGVSKLNFTQVISPELMQKATSGGPESQQAMMEAMNRVAQATAAQQQVQTADYMKTAFAEMKNSLLQELGQSQRKTAAFDGIRAENPVFAHPATQPILGAVVSSLTQQHPNASAAEIQTMAKEYVQSFASAINPAPASSGGFAAPKAGDLNWASWADNGKF